jgi:hypothetical protein
VVWKESNLGSRSLDKSLLIFCKKIKLGTARKYLIALNKIVFIFVLLVSVLLGSTGITPVMAQDFIETYEDQRLEAKTFDGNSWEKLSKELDYSGKPKETKPRETPDLTPPDTPPDTAPFDFPDLSPLFQVILAIVVLSLLAWLIFTFIQNNELKITPPEEGTVADDQVDLSQVRRLEEELDRRDVNPFLAKAEQEENYHLAVRLHYLALLKQLHQQKLIQWKKDRTNRFYLNQMRQQESYQNFRDLTLTFEQVWYGNHYPAQAEYQDIKAAFQLYRQGLQSLTTA